MTNRWLAVFAALIAFAGSSQAAFGASGRWQRAWGKDVVSGGGTGFEICTVAANCKAAGAGALGGEMFNPEGVATDGAGNVYVADVGNQRIEKFDPQGNFMRAWGKDVVTGGGTGFEICTVAGACKAGAAGTLGGEMNGPASVAADSAGNVYVADRLNNRIEKFDSDGNFLRAWGKDVDSGGGTGFEICTVAASCKAGTTGGLAGELNDPEGVGADPGGTVYVADTLNTRIDEFDSQGDFLRAWGKDVDSSNPSGDFEVCLAASCRAGFSGGLGGEFSFPFAVAPDAAGNVYVADFGNQRIQRFDSQGTWQRAWGKDVVTGGTTQFEVCTVAANCQAAGTGVLGGEMNGPEGVAVDDAGRMYVADSNNQRIQKFDGLGTFLRTWGKDVDSGGGTGFEICTVAGSCKAGLSSGAAGGEMNGAGNVGVGNGQDLYVTDVNNNRIQKFVDPALTVQKAGSGAGTVTSSPASIDCGGTCSSSFDVNSTVTLAATPVPGSTFVGWSGGGCAGAGPCQLTIATDTTVTATFALIALDPGRILERLGLSNTKFRSLRSGGAIAKRNKAPLGTTVSYALTEAANVKFKVQRATRGHKKGRRCVTGKPGKRTGTKKCTAFRSLGSFTRQSPAGPNHFKFSGRIRGRKLKPGRYRLAAVATDSAGRHSPTLTEKFIIVK